MDALMDMKRALIRFYARFDTYLTAAGKFLIAFLTLFYLNRVTGYLDISGQIPLLLIVAAFCSFLPSNALILAGAVYLEGQFWGCSLEAAIVGMVLLLTGLLLYFSFLPRQTYVVVFTILCIGLKLPLAVPVVCALLSGPGTLAGILFGTCVYYGAHGLFSRTDWIMGLNAELLNHILKLFGTLFLQLEFVLMLVLLTAVFLVVCLIRHLSVRYSWTIAWCAGALTYGLLYGIGIVLLGISVSPILLAADLLLGVLGGLVVQFLFFSLDYRKVEYLQFEDDDYYYYVKAVAKLDAADRTGEFEEGE